MSTEDTESRRRISVFFHFSGSVILEPHDKELLATRNELVRRFNDQLTQGIGL